MTEYIKLADAMLERHCDETGDSDDGDIIAGLALGVALSVAMWIGFVLLILRGCGR